VTRRVANFGGFLDVRHAEVCDDRRERFASVVRFPKCVDPLSSAIGENEHVAVLLESTAQGSQNDRVVVHDENP
jgi:hypothetical protein